MAFREQLRTWAKGPWAYPVAGVIGFLEGSFLIIAVEPLLIPLLLARARTVWLLAAMPVIGNVLAALLMYALGAWLAEPVIEPFVAMINGQEDYAEALRRLRENGFWALFLVGVTPFPFQLGTAAAGAAGYSLPMFILAVAVSRGLRYYVFAALVRVAGARAEKLIDKYQMEIFIGGMVVFLALTVLLFVL